MLCSHCLNLEAMSTCIYTFIPFLKYRPRDMCLVPLMLSVAGLKQTGIVCSKIKQHFNKYLNFNVQKSVDLPTKYYAISTICLFLMQTSVIR